MSTTIRVPVYSGLCLIVRITTPLHNQGSRRRSRRWKSLSAGSMVGSEDWEFSSSSSVWLPCKQVMLWVPLSPFPAVTLSDLLCAVRGTSTLSGCSRTMRSELCCYFKFFFLLSFLSPSLSVLLQHLSSNSPSLLYSPSHHSGPATPAPTRPLPTFCHTAASFLSIVLVESPSIV